MTPRESAAAAAQKARVQAARAAMWEELPGGYALGPDTPPGVGWVLRLPQPVGRKNSRTGDDYRPRKYYLTRRQALAAYENHLRAGWTGWGPPPAGMDPGDVQRAREAVRISQEGGP